MVQSQWPPLNSNTSSVQSDDANSFTATEELVDLSIVEIATVRWRDTENSGHHKHIAHTVYTIPWEVNCLQDIDLSDRMNLLHAYYY